MAEWNQKRVEMASATPVLRMIISCCYGGRVPASLNLGVQHRAARFGWKP